MSRPASRGALSSRPGSVATSSSLYATSERSTVLLLKELVRLHFRSKDGISDASRTVHLLRFAIRIVGSKIAPPPSLSSSAVLGDKIVRKLFVTNGSEAATRASQMVSTLTNCSTFVNIHALLLLFDSLSGSANERPPMSLTSLQEPILHGASSDEGKLTNSSSSLDKFRTGDPPAYSAPASFPLRSPSPPPPPPPPMPASVSGTKRSAEETDRADVRRSSSDVQLLREAMSILQCVNGHLVKYDGTTHRYSVASSLPLSEQGLLVQVCEVGYLVRSIRSFCTGAEISSEPGASAERSGGQFVTTAADGATCAALRSAINSEMDDFYAQLAAVEGQIKSERTWSLRRLLTWCGGVLKDKTDATGLMQPSQKLFVLNEIVASCEGVRGGRLLTLLEEHTKRGDCVPAFSAMTARVFEAACQPLREMLLRWLAEGVISDDTSQDFFVHVDDKVDVSRLWSSKYTNVADMVPSFIGMKVAQPALIAGKSVNFLRESCEDSEWVLHRALQLRRQDEQRQREGIESAFVRLRTTIVNCAAEAADRVKTLLFNKFGLVSRLTALRSYMLLARGDFALALTDGLGDALDQPASMLLRNNLVGTLESAVRPACSTFEDSDATDEEQERLDVRVVEAQRKTDVGWDVFQLDYRISEPPLAAIFGASEMMAYTAISSFLWELKRMDYYLKDVWQKQRRWSASQTDGEGAAMLMRCSFLRAKMQQFMLNVNYYIMYEVLDGCWKLLTDELAAARDLDEIIVAHTRYLNLISERALLTEGGRVLRTQLMDIFDVICRFRNVQMTLSSNHEDILLSKSVSENNPPSHMRRASISNGSGVGKHLAEVEVDFEAKVLSMMETLQQLDYNDPLTLLLLRLDFNEFYSRRPLRKLA